MVICINSLIKAALADRSLMSADTLVHVKLKVEMVFGGLRLVGRRSMSGASSPCLSRVVSREGVAKLRSFLSQLRQTTHVFVKWPYAPAMSHQSVSHSPSLLHIIDAKLTRPKYN